MTAPKRIQRKRIRDWRMPEGAVYVGRPGILGNPFKAKFMSNWYGTKNQNEAATIGFRRWLLRTDHLWFDQDRRKKVLDLLPLLKGKDLACWCALPEPGEPDHCHAAVLLELANPELREKNNGQFQAAESYSATKVNDHG